MKQATRYSRPAGLLCLCLFLLPALLTAAPQAESPFPQTDSPFPAAGTSGLEVEYGARDLAGDTRDFAFDLFRAIAVAEAEENLILSPHSIATAILMLYAGAEGATASQIEDALRFSASGSALIHAAGELQALLMPTEDDDSDNESFDDESTDGDPFTLRIANGLWLDSHYPIRGQFVAQLQDHLRAQFTGADFANDPDGTRQGINGWIERQTEGKIADLLPPGSITPLTRLVLANAVYFLAGWQHPFRESATRDGRFTIAAGLERRVPLMQLEARLPVSMEGDTIAVELPYAGGSTSFIAFMPRDPSAWDSWQAGLDRESFERMLQSLRPTQAAVTMPRFSSETSLSLPNALRGLGMRDAFDPNRADLSGISGNRDLYATDIIHRSVIEVDEEGTEAAAATAVIIGVRSMVPTDPVQIRLDRPFVYTIYDRETGSILFIGRVSDPSL
ncbi:MAG: serpin family protein [Spirochaetaceae bacterium]|nr:MAG: serpin family protein [Spirochaetaceae bacterium]